jgi:hypothetical protein
MPTSFWALVAVRMHDILFGTSTSSKHALGIEAEEIGGQAYTTTAMAWLDHVSFLYFADLLPFWKLISP